MEEIRAAALAYYENLSTEHKTLAWTFYRALDTDGDGNVNLQEYMDFMREAGYGVCIQPSFFRELDKNGDGILDFEEVLTFYYMVRASRLVFCDGCRIFIKGLFFTCVECFHRADDTYDLCCNCYRNKRYNVSQHTQFLDNYTLLRSKRPSFSATTLALSTRGQVDMTSRSLQINRGGSKTEKAMAALTALEKALKALERALESDIVSSAMESGSVATEIASACSIM